MASFDRSSVPEEQFDHEIKEGSINISYGRDRVNGFWICVADKRLTVNADTTEPLKSVYKRVNHSGKGIYLRAFTGPFGFGQPVSSRTMAQLWKDYGALEEHMRTIDRVKDDLRPPELPTVELSKTLLDLKSFWRRCTQDESSATRLGRPGR